MCMDLNEKIRELRREMGLNQKAFAEHFGIPLRTVQDWEASRRTPPPYIPRLMRYQWEFEKLKSGSINKEE